MESKTRRKDEKMNQELDEIKKNNIIKDNPGLPKKTPQKQPDLRIRISRLTPEQYNNLHIRADHHFPQQRGKNIKPYLMMLLDNDIAQAKEEDDKVCIQAEARHLHQTIARTNESLYEITHTLNMIKKKELPSNEDIEEIKHIYTTLYFIKEKIDKLDPIRYMKLEE